MLIDKWRKNVISINVCSSVRLNIIFLSSPIMIRKLMGTSTWQEGGGVYVASEKLWIMSGNHYIFWWACIYGCELILEVVPLIFSVLLLSHICSCFDWPFLIPILQTNFKPNSFIACLRNVWPKVAVVMMWSWRGHCPLGKTKKMWALLQPEAEFPLGPQTLFLHLLESLSFLFL